MNSTHPKQISYLKRLLPILKSLGATGLLIEYEDMFPYTKPMQKISAKNCYSKADIRDLLHAAACKFNLRLTEFQIFPLNYYVFFFS